MAVTRRSEADLSAGPRIDEVQRPAVSRRAHGPAAAVRFTVVIAVSGLAFLIMAALWVSTCTGVMAVDTMACGAPQRTFLGVGAPLILLGGAVWAFISTYRAWRDDDGDAFWAWQGAGWFLSTVFLVTLAMGFPALAGPA
jgi:hypothetical protein